MADFNLPSSLMSQNSQVRVEATATPARSSVPQTPGLPVLLPISILNMGQQVKVSDVNNRLLATAPFAEAISQAATAGISEKAQSIVLFSQSKSLFDALISTQQQKTILDAISKQPNLIGLSLAGTEKITLRDAVVTSIAQRSVTLALTPPLGQLDKVTLELKNSPATIKIGQPVQVEVQQLGTKWRAKLIVSSATPVTTKLNSESQKGTVNQSELLNNQRSQAITPQMSMPTIVNDSPIAARDPLVQAVVRNILQEGISLYQAPSTIRAIVKILSQTPSVSNQINQSDSQLKNIQNQTQQPLIALKAITDIIQQPSNLGLLRLSANGELTVSSKLPVAQLPLSQTELLLPQPDRTDRLQNLSKSVEHHVERFFALPDKQRLQLLAVLKSLPTAKIDMTQATSSITNLASSDTVTVKGIESNNIDQTMASVRQTGIPKAFAEQLSTLIRQHFVNAGSQTETALSLAQVITQLTQSGEGNIRDLGKQLQQALLPFVSQQQPDAAQIKSLLEMPAMPISTSSLNKIAPVNSMLAGLIALLQISLATRLPQRQPATADKVGLTLNQISQIATAGSTLATKVPSSNQPIAGAKILQEFTQLEQRNQLLRTLSKALSTHHYSKLASAEAALQGTDSLYYSLPSYANSSQRDIELVVKRDAGKRNATEHQSAEKAFWHLTMLMDVGELGEMLSKCKLKDNELALDIYTSSEQLKICVIDMLPVLTKRLSSLGLDIISSHCQLGKIPDTLRPKPYQLLHTQA
jgi:hypothetical protein